MTKVFIDTNIFIYAHDLESPHHQESVNILISLLKKNYQMLTTPYVINELHFFYLRKYGHKRAKSLVKKVLSTPDLILMDELLTKKDILNICKLAVENKLKTFDAYHAYFCKKQRVKQIATFDNDFAKLPWVNIYSA